jgi:hypothetical protein
MAPIERRAQCPLPRKRRAAAGRQQREAIMQARGYPFNAENRGASRRELDGERYAVEVPADRGNRREVFGVRREAGVQGFCSRDEQLHRTVLHDVVRCRLPGSGHLERRNAIDGLAVDPQDFAAGCHNRGARAQTREGLGQVRHRVDDVFAIIEHEHEMSSTNGASDRLRRNLAGKLQPERAGYRGWDEAGVGQRGEFDEPPPVFKVGEKVTDGFDGQRGLSDAAGAGQSHHSIGRNEVSDGLASLGPTNQTRNDRGKIVRRRRSGCAGQG